MYASLLKNLSNSCLHGRFPLILPRRLQDMCCQTLLLFGALVSEAVYGLQKKGGIVEELRE